ncbi:MAG: PSD1 domain-containing protein [Planctomycetaceae bacterium]|nr:PSD1 domain-containing protein [Planctomycetaceae bacterium]
MRQSMMMGALAVAVLGATHALAADAAPQYEATIAPLLKSRCVKCHGPATQEGKLNLSTAAGVLRGGGEGPVLTPHDLKASRLWQRVEANEMPPEEPLSAKEKELLQKWIVAGAPGLPKAKAQVSDGGEHWSFRKLRAVPVPTVATSTMRTPVDAFIIQRLQERELSLRPEADRSTLLRRASLVLLGIPPTLSEIEAFHSDDSPDAYDRAVERLLTSPQFGPRWGKYWLDAAGYADSNGYFNADSERPLAWRYRDYVIESFNANKPFDRFIHEQLAGDELSRFVAGGAATPEQRELLTATHYLRNGQDGTGESDGNPDEVRIDRYSALEGSMHNATASLLALTIQCAKCHDHKFEPITQRDYYSLQAFFYPAFNLDRWVKPNERFVYAPLPGETERWEAETREVNETLDRLRSELAAWVKANRPAGELLFEDPFDSASLAERWSSTAPGDDAPGGTVPVNVASDKAPGADVRDGRLRIIEKGSPGGSWLSTKQSFDWTPDAVGESIQATFDLIDVRVDPSDMPAMRVGYYIALHDFNDNSPTPGGNLLIDGHPTTSTTLYLDNPGQDATQPGAIGVTGYMPGHNYGVRVTHLESGKFRIEHLVDWQAEEKSVELNAADLPDGGFGFEYTGGRSFVVDNVRIERFPRLDARPEAARKYEAELQTRRAVVAAAARRKAGLSEEKPGKIAWTSDLSPVPPDVFLLERGNYAAPKDKVDPRPPAALQDSKAPFEISTPFEGAQTTGRRLALARWLTAPGSPQEGLVSRVQVNRLWQRCFGRGLVATPDNLGVSGSPPTHPELLDHLAREFVLSGWDVRHVLRLIVKSAAFRQRSDAPPEQIAADPDNRLLSRFPVQRLDAEAIRDSLLAVSGDLDPQNSGPPIRTERNGDGEVLVNESQAGALRRAVFLFQRRTQVTSFLQVFDAPSIVFHSTHRPSSTTPLQSLALLNSEFSFARAESFARRLETLADEPRRVRRAFLEALGRAPREAEASAALEFLRTQAESRGGASDARRAAWVDFCQSLFASNEFLYID